MFGERLATQAASRLYVDDSSWQREILGLMGKSQVVVLQVGPTEGTWWELVNTVRRVEPTRLLWLLTDVAASPQLYDEFRAKVEQNLPVRLPRSIGISESRFLRFRLVGRTHST